MKNHTIRCSETICEEVDIRAVERRYSGYVYVESEPEYSISDLENLATVADARGLTYAMEYIPSILLTSLVNLKGNPTEDGFQSFGNDIGREMSGLTRTIGELVADRDRMVAWINNAATTARRYTEQNEGCDAGKRQFLVDMGVLPLEREFNVDVVATQSITIMASSEEEASDRISDRVDNYDWSIDYDSTTIEEA